MDGSMGGRFFVPKETHTDFNEKCFKNYKAGIKMYLSERVPPRSSNLPSKFFIDIDFDETCNNVPDLKSLSKACLFSIPHSDDCIVSVRGQDKLHMVFPSIIVTYKQAIQLYESLLVIVSTKYPNFENSKKGWKSSLDKSVYTSGLRMLTSAKPLKDDRPDYYTVMDVSTWQPVPLTLELLNRASIYVPHDPIQKKDSVISQKLEKLPTDTIVPSDLFCSYFKAEYSVRKRISQAQISDQNVIIPLTDRWCFIADKEHKSNHPYIIINETGSKFKCHDENCKGKEYKPIDPSLFPKEIRREYLELVSGDKSLVDENMLTLAKQECEQNMTHYFPKSDIDPVRAIKDMMVSNLENFYLPCQECGNDKTFIAETNSEGLCLRCSACSNQWPERRMPVPSRYEALNKYLFQFNVTINNIVNNYTTPDLFIGDYCNDGLEVFEEPGLNSVFLASLDSGSENRVAQFLLALYGSEFHCTADKDWFHFNGQYWLSGNHAKMNFYHKISDCLIYFTNAINFYKNLDIQDEITKQKTKHIQKIKEKLENSKNKDGILKEAICEFHHANPTFLDKLNRKNLLVFNNGVFDFESGTFRDGRTEDFMTMSTTNDYVPYDESNPSFQTVYHFLKDILPNPDVLNYILKVLGLSLTLDVSQQKLWILTGGGGNGKSLLFNLLERSLGDYYGTASPTLLTRKREDANQANEALTSLELARSCVITEAESKDTIQVGLMKQFTGGDTVTSRKNYGSQLKFKPKFKLFFICNDIPEMSENNPSVWRRVKVIDFPIKFVENPNLHDKNEKQINFNLNDELESCSSAFLSILIHYYQKFKQEGLDEPDAVTMSTTKYKKENDIIQNYVDECLEKVDESAEYLFLDDCLQWTDICKDVRTWACKEFGIQEKNLPKRSKIKEGFVKLLGEPMESTLTVYLPTFFDAVEKTDDTGKVTTSMVLKSNIPKDTNLKIKARLRGWKSHRMKK